MVSTEASKVTVTVLTDDTVASTRFIAEHGVSILVEWSHGRRWLVDTGTTDVFLENAKRLGVSLDNLDGIAITHGHDDHTGGLTFYPRLKGNPPVYGHPYLWHKSYQIRPGQPVRVTGMPYLARKHAFAAFRPVNGVVRLDDGLFFFTDIERAPGSFAPVAGNFFNEDETGAVPLIDDASVVLRTVRGMDIDCRVRSCRLYEYSESRSRHVSGRQITGGHRRFASDECIGRGTLRCRVRNPVHGNRRLRSFRWSLYRREGVSVFSFSLWRKGGQPFRSRQDNRILKSVFRMDQTLMGTPFYA